MSDGGKGSRARPFSVDQNTFASNWDRIFRKDQKMQVRVQERSEDIGKCGCGRSPTGRCIGWHGLSEEDYRVQLAEWEERHRHDGTNRSQ
jgi:hypothetical protein